jgi:uncharacterized protein
VKSALLYEEHQLRTFALVLETGDEAMHALESWAAEQRVRASQFSAIGAFERATVAYFDWSSKQYIPIAIDEQVEVLTLSGDITIEKDKRKVHAHVVLGKSDATAHGGHLMKGFVRPTLEVIVTELPRHLYRRHDPASGIALIDPFVNREQS